MTTNRGYKSPDLVDVHVGSRVKLRRVLLGLSQEKLANGMGITFQQVQKYERGINRISASRLYRTAQLLDVSVAYFFEELENDGSSTALGDARAMDIEAAGDFPEDLMSRRETLNLLHHYYSINDVTLRQRFVDLLRGVAGSEVIG